MPRALRGWLLDTASLTLRLQQLCPGRFRVRLLSQSWGKPFQDEARVLGMPHGSRALIRQVHLLCGEQAWIYARTVIPVSSLCGRLQRLAHLGTRPLGGMLFADPGMQRGGVELARTRHRAGHACRGNLSSGTAPAEIWGRRTVFRLADKPLLVSEIFLPDFPGGSRRQAADQRPLTVTGRVAMGDRASVYRQPWRQHLKRLRDYVSLMRLDKPIGIFLLLWPHSGHCWWPARVSLIPNVLLIFVLGVILMRSAGCVINDYADRDIDRHVSRTQNRPLTAGRVTTREAKILFGLLALAALLLVLQLNRLTILLSIVGAFLAVSYPFMKRFTYLPQVYLGAAFGWAVPMAFAAELDSVPPIAWLMFVATILWATAYDTMYAMVDRMDDIALGVKSTAILFGESDRQIIGLIQVHAAGLPAHDRLPGGTGLDLLPRRVCCGCVLAGYQQYLIRFREREACFRAFLNNNWLGCRGLCRDPAGLHAALSRLRRRQRLIAPWPPARAITQTSTRTAPACFRARASSLLVWPVVMTSSIMATCNVPGGRLHGKRIAQVEPPGSWAQQ